MTDILKTVTKSKVSPTKGYNAAFNTSNTAFTDVTSLSISVPNNAFYCVKGILKEDTGASTTGTLQLLLNGVQVYTTSVTCGGGGAAQQVTADSLIFQNTTGTTQIAKVQIKTDSGGKVYVSTMSIIAGTFVIPIINSPNNIQEIVCDITSIDFLGAMGDGSSYISYDGIQIVDNTSSASTYSTLEKLVNAILFASNGSGYVAFDWAGKSIVTI